MIIKRNIRWPLLGAAIAMGLTLSSLPALAASKVNTAPPVQKVATITSAGVCKGYHSDGSWAFTCACGHGTCSCGTPDVVGSDCSWNGSQGLVSPGNHNVLSIFPLQKGE